MQAPALLRGRFSPRYCVPVALRLYDSLTRETVEFEPLVPGKVGMYVCGATVQAPPHVGHIRSGVAFDVVRRWLMARNFEVTFIRNVTDIDDKILNKGAEQHIPYWDVAMRNERAFTRAYDVLGCMPPTYEPRATGHIPEMVALMEHLIETGHGYAAGGDVYFSVSSYPAYGALSGQKPDDMQAAGDSSSSVKKDPRDFAMWKSAKPGEPAWETPWGPGRPGWHIECSAMAGKYLGDAFDIHGGGLDLIFPHHENEIAQSCATGDMFAHYWMHNAWVTTAGEKMSKSLGNSLLVDEVVKRFRPIDVRFYLVSGHYRSMLEYSDDSVREAGQGFSRIEGFLTRAAELLGVASFAVDQGSRQPAFDAAMDDDFGTPAAIAVIHETVRDGNAALTAEDRDAVEKAAISVTSMLDVLGLNPFDAQWQTDSADSSVIDALMGTVIAQRQAARERKDYAAADAIRDELAALGITLEDTPRGVRWTLGGAHGGQ